MTTTTLARSLIGALLLGPTLLGQAAPADLGVWVETDPAGLRLTAQIDGASGSTFALLASFTGDAFDLDEALVLALGGVDPNGTGAIQFAFPEGAVPPAEAAANFAAAYLAGGQVLVTEPATYALGVDGPFCDRLDFNYTLGEDDATEMVGGRVISDQWADVNLSISADNATPGHPDLCILYDTNVLTGGDSDLQVGLGTVCIIAENDGNTSPADDLIDDPDDEQNGGSIFYDFADGATLCSVTLIDIDEVPGTELRFYRGGDTASPDLAIPVDSLGDGSVQVVDFLERGITRFEVFFRGSGAVGGIDLITCPRLVNFDETSTGVPLDPPIFTGEEITDQFANIGLTISGINSANGNRGPFGSPCGPQLHPNKVILFDSGNVTGEDTDLATPHDPAVTPEAIGNDEPLGRILIIAEDDCDISPADGLVDDPDDEALGGTIFFEFEQDVIFLSARVLDVDTTDGPGLQAFFTFFDADMNMLDIEVIPENPDGSVVLVEPNQDNVRFATLELPGSGAVTRIRFCPDDDNDDPVPSN